MLYYVSMNETDEILVELSKNGNNAAFNILVERHIDHIYNFVKQYCKENEDADDITQSSFIKAWKHIKSFKTGNKFTTWLFTIARNTALDHIKKRRSYSFSQMDIFGSNSRSGNSNGDNGDMSFVDTLKDPEPLPSEVFQRNELAIELSLAMETLPQDWRAVLVMHYTDEMTFEDIAMVLGRPMNTVKSWHRRSLIKIREMLILHHND